jgi:Uma2 family endonuclease
MGSRGVCYPDCAVTDPAERDRFGELYRRFSDLPESARAEIVAGEIRVMPRPRPRHVRSATRLGSLLDSGFGFDSAGPGGWVILIEPEIRFSQELRNPDLAGWRIERYEEPDDGPYLVIPDWICEVLSPSTAQVDRGEKMPLYARHGVRHLWLVDPDVETLEIYRREGELWLAIGTLSGATRVQAEPFDAIELDLGALWRRPGR